MNRDGRAVYVDLVAGAYDAALDRTRWPQFLDSLASVFRSDKGLLWTHDFHDRGADLGCQNANLSASVGFDSQALESFAAYYSYRNVWTANQEGQAEGTTLTSSSLYCDKLLVNTEFYNDWLRPQNLFYAFGSTVTKQGTRAAKMSFLRSKQAGSYDNSELRLFGELMPHLQSALNLHHKLHHLQALSAVAMVALDAMPYGIILLEGDGSYLHANLRAHELMDKTSALKISATGTMRASTAAQDSRLQVLIHRAVQTGMHAGVQPGGLIRLTSTIQQPLHVMVTPLPERSTPFGEHAAAAMFCSTPGREGERGALAGALERLYAMTPAEARLTQALVSGLSLKDYADLRQISINTARTQLKAATAKTDAKRQSDLVRIVLTGPAVLRMDPI